MTEKFIQGSAPFFIGLGLSSGTEILENLRNNLNDCGWTITDNISTNNYFLAQGQYDVYDEDNNFIQTDDCWVKFTDDTIGNIIVNGDYDGTNLYLSSDYLVPYSTTNDFRLFGGFNGQAGCFLIYNNLDPNPTIEGCHFGFLGDRAGLLDSTSIYVGNLSVDSWRFVQCALDFHSQLIKWKTIANDYHSTSAWTTSNNSTHPPLALDFLLNGNILTGDMDGASGNNMGYFAQNGRKNKVTGQSVPLLYGMLEGLGATNAYGKEGELEGKNVGHDLYLRGFVEYVRSGCRKELTGNRIIDRKNQELLICKEVGGLAMQCGRIKRIKAILDTPIPIKTGLTDVLALYNDNNNYVLNTDYTVDYPNNTITLLSSGNITVDSIVYCSYAL